MQGILIQVAFLLIVSIENTSPGGSDVISVHSDDTTSSKGVPSDKSLTYCWMCNTPSYLGKSCSSMNKDPDFRPVKSNILYPHKKKKHTQELLREVKEQMNHVRQ